MSSLYRKEFGQKGEDEACLYLRKHGYEIIERNFRVRNGEIDIIAIDTITQQKTLSFIEVKTRFNDDYGDPLEAITYYKLQALQRTAQYYQITHPRLPQLMRLDAVAVTLDRQYSLIDIRLVKNIS